MKSEKAQEFFSAYYEGELEGGLKEQFEDLLGSDPRVADDFASFVQSMEQLQDFGQIEVKVPEDLHEKISRKLDKHFFELKSEAKPSFWKSFRLQLLGAATVVTLFGSVFFMNQNAKTSTAGFAPGDVTVSNGSLDVKLQGNQAVLVSNTLGEDEIRVIRAADGEVIKAQTRKEGQRLEMPLLNSGKEAVTLRIEVKDKATYVVVPGSLKSQVSEGNGNMVKLAEAAATFYRRPVLLDVKDRDLSVSWSFDATNPSQSSFKGGSITAEVRQGLLRLRN